MTPRKWLHLFIATLFALVCLSPPGTGYAATITVDTTADDDTINDNCTLREAMIAARDNVIKDNCLIGATVDTIEFDIDSSTDPGCNAGTGVCTIQPMTNLPALYGSGMITIDGYSQPGASPASGSTPAEIRIVIDGSLDGDSSAYGFYIQSPDNVLQGMAINQFDVGILIGGSSATDNAVHGCYIGTDETGTLDRGNSSAGISLSAAGSGNLIGGIISEHRNLISGNSSGAGSGHGIDLSSGSTGTNIYGNYIGTTPDGLSALPNDNGVNIRFNAYANNIGGSDPGSINLISGNSYDGITLNGGSGNPHSNRIEGNYIGVDATGSTALANGGNGVQIINGAFANVVGPGNVISGNTQSGVLIWTSGTVDNQVVGNLIGTDASGTSALPNMAINGAVFINSGAAGNMIGGDVPAERNVISGNAGQGVRINGVDTNSNIVSGNYIGVDSTGTAALINTYEGVGITSGASFNTIGGDTEGERNIIAADYSGVKIEGSGSNYPHDNTISGNYIGTDVTGTVGFNVGTGVSLSNGAHHNTIGGATIAERNVISGNGGRGLNISGLGTDFNQVLGNYIGVDANGSNPLGNPSDGIRVWLSAQDNTIGPGNVIANNGFQGIYIYGADTDRNVITQNSIYGHSNWNITIAADGANEAITPPEITAVNFGLTSVSGTTSPVCMGCTIEVFTSLSSFPAAGRTYLGAGTTDGSGNWTVSTPGLFGPYISATLTEVTKGTSIYSNRLFTTITATYLPLITR